MKMRRSVDAAAAALDVGVGVVGGDHDVGAAQREALGARGRSRWIGRPIAELEREQLGGEVVMVEDQRGARRGAAAAPAAPADPGAADDHDVDLLSGQPGA